MVVSVVGVRRRGVDVGPVGEAGSWLFWKVELVCVAGVLGIEGWLFGERGVGGYVGLLLSLCFFVGCASRG